MGDADPDDEGPPPLVYVVRAAGVLWAGHGTLVLAAGVVIYAHGGLLFFFPAAVVALVAVKHLAAGVRAAAGWEDDPRGGAVWSILSALAVPALAGALLATGRVDRPTAAGVAGYGVSLLVAGVLALAGRRDYLAWHAHRHSWPPD